MDAAELSRSRRSSEGGTDGREHRSSRLQKHDNGDDEERDGGRRRSHGEGSEGRKRPSSSSRAGSGDEDDYDVKRDSSSKNPRKSSEGERRSSDNYKDREVEGGRRSRDEESGRSSSRKADANSSFIESLQSKNKSKVGSPNKESRYAERKEGSKEKSHDHRDQESYSRSRRWNDKDADKRDQESGRSDKYDSRSTRASDHDKQESVVRDRTLELRYDSGEAKGRALGSSGENDVRSAGREDRISEGERSKNRGRFDVQDENDRPVTVLSEAKLVAERDGQQLRDKPDVVAEDLEPDSRNYNNMAHGEKGETHRPMDSSHGGHDEVKNLERSDDMDEDGHVRARDRSGREVARSKRSRSPERSGRYHKDSDDHDRGFRGSESFGFKSTEKEDEYRDDRSSKGKESNWIDRNREPEGSRENWKRNQTRQDTTDRDTESDHSKEWGSMRRENDKMDDEKFHSRSFYRRDTRSRPEGGKSSSFGNQNDNYDRIEIVPNRSLDFGRHESFSPLSGRRVEVGSQQDFPPRMNDEWGHPPEEKVKLAHGYSDDLQESFKDELSTTDQNFRKYPPDSQRMGGQKGPTDFHHSGPGQSPSGSSQSSFGNNQGAGSFNRNFQQGPKGARTGRGGGRGGRLVGRESQGVGVPLPMMGPPFGHLGLPPSPMQPMTPNMQHSPVPQIVPGVLIRPFPGPLVWPGGRGVDMNILGVPPGIPSIHPPGLAGARFAPNMGMGPNFDMYFNQPDPGRAGPPISSPVNATGRNSRGAAHDKPSFGWGPSKGGGPSGKAPSRGEQNDYSQNFVDTGTRPQNFIRELELTNVVEDYPKLRELIQKKDEIVAKSASPPMYYKCDLREHALSPEFFGTKFDVILVDPPWEEYVHRAPGVTDHMECWTFEEIQNLKIELIADTPSFIFLWVGDGVGLEQGRQCLKKWGFRRCEDICWVKTNKSNATPGLRHDSHTLFQHSKEHCLMGIKGTVRRSIDGHIIHANIDTDVVIAEEPPYGSTKKPDDMYRIIEHFSLGKRRLELFGEDHNIRSGWLTVGKGLSSSNFNAEAYVRNFSDREGKVWPGGGGRNPPPGAPHLVVTTPDIESLRPKSPPPKNQQQQQQQPIPLMSSSNSNNQRALSFSQNTMAASHSGLNQDTAGSEPPTPVSWGASRGGHDDRYFDGFEINPTSAQANGDHLEFEPHS